MDVPRTNDGQRTETTPIIAAFTTVRSASGVRITRGRIPIDDVVKVVEGFLGTKGVRHKGRNKRVSYARHMVMYLAYEGGGAKYPFIARHLMKDRELDHTTVIHGVRKMQKLIDLDWSTRRTIVILGYRLFGRNILTALQREV